MAAAATHHRRRSPTDETYAFTATTSQHKYHYPLPKLLLLGILAGEERVVGLLHSRRHRKTSLCRRGGHDPALHSSYAPRPLPAPAAGAYIGLGYSLCCLVGGLLSPEFRRDQPGVFNLIFGIYGFPMGLTLCVVAGGDLFTSNCMYATVGWWEGERWPCTG